MDFDPSESIVFPQAVSLKYSSPEFMQAIKAAPVPAGQTALWHLGQNSWILKSSEGKLAAIDPYLTDFCASQRTGETKPKSRLLPVFLQPEDLDVDVVLLTHSHADHADPFTLERLKIKSTARFLAPWQVLPILKNAGIPDAQVTLMHPHQTETAAGFKVTGTFAEPTDYTDLNHMGFALQTADGAVFYNTGDTAKTELLGHVAALKPKVMTICINGGYHNLSHWEAAEIAALIKPQIAVPAHYDMFPHNLQAPHMFRKSLWEKDKTIQFVRVAYSEPWYF